MKILCVGGGPAGLYFAISAKLRDAGHDITIIERDPPGATYGWGVVCQDNLLDKLYRNDHESAQRIRAASALWQEQQVILRGDRIAYLPGYGFSISRARLLDVLTRRAADLGVGMQHHTGVEDVTAFGDADLVVAADGAHSRVRQLHGDAFGTTLTYGRNPYIWLGTPKVFTSFTFAFEETPAGWIWCYGYPTSTGLSTFIIECPPETWHGLGLDTAGHDDGVRLLETIFERTLDRQALISRSRGEPARWLRFAQVTNRTWQHDNVVLLGDAAHTTHFTMGQGTRLAVIDALTLARFLNEHDTVPGALRAFDREGRAALGGIQAAARTGAAWFEHIDRYVDHDVVDFAYAMSGRQGSHRPWRYQKHRATQLTPVRKARRTIHSGKRAYLALRRGEPYSLALSLRPLRRDPARHAAPLPPTTARPDGALPEREAPDGRTSIPQLAEPTGTSTSTVLPPHRERADAVPANAGAGMTQRTPVSKNDGVRRLGD
jgi:anthraniloyl-CoA monooxygenase